MNDQCAWFDFSELCYQPLGAADYISLCRRFPVLIMDGVPQLDSQLPQRSATIRDPH
jgi:protein AFG1